MKRCPTCQRTYADQSLNFCLDDGGTLLLVADTNTPFDSGATLAMHEGNVGTDPLPPTEISIPRGAATEHMPQTAPTIQQRQRHTAPDAHIASPQPKSQSHLLTAGITAIAILLLVLVGIGIALLMKGSGNGANDNQRSAANTNNPSNVNASNAGQSENAASKTNANNQNAAVPSPNNDTGSSGSLNVTASASSTRAPLKAFSYAPANALDNSLLTAWIEGVPGPGKGEWIRFDFDREVKLKHVVMTPGYFKTAALWSQNNRLAAATLYFSDGSSRYFSFPDRMQMQTLDTAGIRTRFVRLVIEDFYPGSVDSEDTPISEITFDWEP